VGAMNCDKCEHFNESDGECSITKCPLVIRDECLEEAAKVLDKKHTDNKVEANHYSSASCDCYKYAAFTIRAMKSGRGE